MAGACVWRCDICQQTPTDVASRNIPRSFCTVVSVFDERLNYSGLFVLISSALNRFTCVHRVAIVEELPFRNEIQKFINLEGAVGHRNGLIISQRRQAPLLEWPGSPATEQAEGDPLLRADAGPAASRGAASAWRGAGTDRTGYRKRRSSRGCRRLQTQGGCRRWATAVRVSFVERRGSACRRSASHRPNWLHGVFYKGR